MSSVWDKLPAEILDEIFSYLPYRVDDVEEDRVTTRPYSDEHIHIFDYMRHVGRPTPFGYEFRNYPKPGELQLRLVCRDFHRTMTRAYFKHEDTIVRPWEESTVQKMRDFIMDEKSAIAPEVSRLRIELSPVESYRDGPSLFDRERSSQGDDDGQNQKELNLMNTSSRAFFPMLEDVVARLPKLERIIAVLPEDWRSDEYDAPNSDDESDSAQGGIQDLGTVVELDLLELVRNSIATIFSSPRINLRFLTYLRLTLPSAYDLAIIGSKISDTVALQLRHLYLEYIDGTGPGGSLEYTRHWDYYDTDGDTDGDFASPSSNLQNRFPNTTHTRDICKLIMRCRNLESLGLHCTQRIDLEMLDWKPTSPSSGFKNIYLYRASTSAEKLISLLCPTSLTAFHMEDVSLTSGTWASVFSHLSTCTSLVYCSIYNVIYNKHGASGHRAHYNHRPWENVDFMWSREKEDWDMFSNLIRTVQKRGAKVSKEMERKEDEMEKKRDRARNWTAMDGFLDRNLEGSIQ